MSGRAVNEIGEGNENPRLRTSTKYSEHQSLTAVEAILRCQGLPLAEPMRP